MRPARALAVVAPMICAGCHAAPLASAPPRQPIAVLAQTLPAMAMTPPVGGVTGGSKPAPRPVGAYSAPVVPGSPAAPNNPPAPGDVSLNFADTDIRTITDQILGGILHQPYTIDPAVTGTATLRTVVPLARAGLIPTLQMLLAQNKAVLVRSGGIYRVMAQADADAAPGLAGGTVIALRYADAAQLAAMLAPYAARGGKIIASPGQNALVVEGDPSTRAALTGLIEALDVDERAGQSYELFPVTAGDPKDVAAAFAAALGANSGDTARPGPATVVPLEQLDAVLVIAKSESVLFDAQRVYAVIDQVRRETIRSWHVYDVQYGRANDAAYVLQQAFTPDSVTAQPTPAATGQAVAALQAQNASGEEEGGGAAPAAGTAGNDQTGAGAAGLLGTLSQTGGGDTLRIIADTQDNALLIYGTAAETDRIDAMLRKIDIPPLEVRIDATIAEVDLDVVLQYGTQFFFKSGGINAVLSSGSTSSLATNFPGFVLSGDGSDAAPLAISALQAVTKVNILSSPELTVLDGQTGSLQVGNLVPYLSQTSQSSSAAASESVNSIDYRETGVSLQVTPHIGSDGLVTLDVAQQVSDVLSGVTTAGIDSPTFSERAVASRVAIEDGHTIGLAGLISDNASQGNSGIPFLKNVPLLGALASSQNNARTRTELLVLITPHVIRTQTDADALTADLQEQLPNAALVPAALTQK
jgi:general secretion pathway protein D